MAQQARTDIGFQGGQVLALRTHEQLIAALADDKAGRGHTLESDDERVQVGLSQVVYVRREIGNRKMGF